MNDMITEDIKILKTKCIPSFDDKYNEEVATRLFNILNKSGNGIGLSCNQIDITDARVCVVNVMEEPLIFINPKIIGLDDEFNTEEGCLSFPNRVSKTKRYKYVTVESDNMGTVMFGPTGNMNDVYNDKQNLQLLESVCVQHEIDHLDGITMFDRSYKLHPITSDKKYGRNHKVQITNGTETKTIKWKKAEPLIGEENGEWSLVLEHNEF